MMRMDRESITKSAVKWIPPNGKRKLGHPKTDWMQTVKEDRKRGGVSWEKIPELAVDGRPGMSCLPCVLMLALKD